MASLRKYHRMMVEPAGRPNSEINVTPLVDVVLVLLIIFMVVTPLLEKDLEVRVPATEQVEDMSEVPPDQLVVSLTPEGDLAINNRKVTPEEYVPQLKAMLAGKSGADRLVFFAPDDRANYGRLVNALDGARQAGAETLGMMTDLSDVAGAPGQAPTPPAPPSPPPAP